MIILRKHKDDDEMIEVLSNRPVTKLYPKGGLLLWGVFHSDIAADLFNDDIAALFNQEGEVEVECKLA